MPDRDTPLGQVDLRTVFRGCRPDEDDAVACRVRETARRLRSRGEPVDLDDFLEAIPWLRESDVSLDAAIDECLEGVTLVDIEAAASRLVEKHPELAGKIQRTVILRVALQTRESFETGTPANPMRLPADYGPLDYDGMPRYELRSVLGAGCQGTVYAAVDRLFSQPEAPSFVAVKIGHRPADPGDEPRHAAEAVRARRVVHPSVVRVLDRGIGADGHVYAAFELIDGVPLDTWLRTRSGRLPAREAAGLVADLCDAVQAAHAAGLVHRDLKPSNILMGRDGSPRVTNFGVAREATIPLDGAFRYSSRGSLAFMSPEQFRCEPGADAPVSDVYTLGGLLFWLLTETFPNGRDAAAAIERLECTGPAPEPPSVGAVRPSVPPALERIVARSLAPRMQDRYGSAQALASDLRAWLSHHPIGWQHPGPASRLRLLARRHPIASAATAVGVLMLAGVTAGVMKVRADSRLRQVALQAVLDQQQLENKLELAEERSAAQQAKIDDALQRIRAWSDIMRESRQVDPAEYIAVLNSLSSAEIFQDPSVTGALLEDRIIAARRELATLERSGQGDSLDAMLWRTMLGTWLVRAGEPDEGIVQLQAARNVMGRVLAAEDPWLLRIEEQIRDASEAAGSL